MERPPERFQEPYYRVEDWIRYEYNGNFASLIRFDEKIFQDLMRLIENPRRKLIIQNGNERVERMGISLRADDHPGLNTRPNTYVVQKTTQDIVQGEAATILRINSQVIDGLIQDNQRKSGSSYADYEKTFTTYLAVVISAGVLQWATREMKDSFKNKPLWTKFFKATALLSFMNGRGRNLVQVSKPELERKST